MCEDETTGDAEAGLKEVLLEHCDWISNVETYKENGVLTRNHGLVIRCDDGSEFQLTIVRSR